MTKWIFSTAIMISCLAFVSCAPTGKNAQGAQSAEAQSTQSAASAEAGGLGVDCDQLMQDISNDCFQASSVDENNQPLPEGELLWVGDYCECYAQLSFQSFGCSGVVEHQKLGEEEFQSTYGDIFAECEAQQVQMSSGALGEGVPVDVLVGAQYLDIYTCSGEGCTLPPTIEVMGSFEPAANCECVLVEHRLVVPAQDANTSEPGTLPQNPDAATEPPPESLP